jgi:hypothetical protein
MARTKINYSKTIIYKLIKNDDYENANIYVGSTTDFTRRKQEHKRNCNNVNSKQYNLKVYQNIRQNGGWTEWKMIEIEKYPCCDNNQAHAREEYWRCELNARLNSLRAFRTEEQIKEYNKQYYIENIDTIKQQNKQYNTENADKIKEYKKEYRTENAEQIKEYQKQYRTENAEQIKESRKEYRTENADIFKKKYDCECGGKYTHENKARHLKLQKHKDFLKTQDLLPN